MAIGVYTFNGTSGHWQDVELTKDCGIIPYLLHKKYGYRSVMVTTKDPNETYPSLKNKTPGLEINYLPNASNFVEAQLIYLNNNFQKIDVMLLKGPYPTYYPLLELYRKLRPDGKAYLALDANSYWMDRIDWQNSDFKHFLEQCDVIATSSRTMQRYLSIKWPFKIEYIPNGFYNFENVDLYVDFKKKKNTILTVGRIGTEQKNNELLIEAFAQIADLLPEWQVKLVGTVQASFKEYLSAFFEEFPKLKERIILMGTINNRRDLIREYQQAKIFALTSRLEGGTPNVVAEALFCGCYQVLTNFDAANEAIDKGKCGVVVENQEELIQQLLILGKNPSRLLAGEKDALKLAKTNYDFEKLIQRLHYLLFKGETNADFCGRGS